MPLFDFKNEGRLKIIATHLLQLMSVCWLLAKLISWKLWIAQRVFPLIPIKDWIVFPSWLHLLLFGFSLLMLLLLILKQHHRLILYGLFIAEIISCIADQNRWQAWEYQYLFMLLLYLLNKSNYQKIITGITFIMAASYFYSGLGKMNESFLITIWDEMVLKKIIHLNAASIQQSCIHYVGYFIALIECLLAVLLFFKPTQKVASVLLIIMHLLILFLLGPFGLSFNKVVWPWNLMMIGMLYFIFIKNKFAALNSKVLLQGWSKLVLIFWGIAPALNYVQLWDNNFSCRFYSGNTPQMIICFNNSIIESQLKPYVSKRNQYALCNNKQLINIQAWAMKEMQVPAYPEISMYKKIKNYLIKNKELTNAVFIFYLPADENNKLRVLEVPLFFQ